MNVCVLDMQPISPAIGGGRLRLLGLYHALGAELSATYVGTYDWPDEPGRDQQLTPGLREITIPLSPEHFAADAKLSAEAGGKTVIDSAFHQLAHLSPDYLDRTRHAARESEIVICAHPWVYPLVKGVVDRRRSMLVYDSQNFEGLLRISLLDDGALGTAIAKEVISIEREFCREADLILACSQEDLELYRDLYGIPCEKIRIVPNGTFTKALTPPTPRQREECRTRLQIRHSHSAIFFGSGYQFNTEAAQFIIQKLAPRLPDVLFIVAGGVGQTLAKLGLQDREPANVRVTGLLSDDDRVAYLYASDFGLNPMFGGSGTNIKMFDYMAAGLPTVTTEIGARGINTLEQRAFLTVTPSDFASSIEMLVQHPATRRQLSRAARQLVTELYSWEHISSALGNLLKVAHTRIGRTNPKFSVIIITFDHQRLDPALMHLGQQAERDFEIIVIDGSEYPWPGADQSTQRGIIYVHSDLRNPTTLKNFGAFLAAGEVIVYLPDGFIPPADWLSRAKPYFVHPDVSCLRCDVAMEGSTNSNGEFPEFIRREAFIRAGQFDTSCESTSVSRRLDQRLRAIGAALAVGDLPPIEGQACTPLANVADWISLSDEEFVSTSARLFLGLAPADSSVRELVSALKSGEKQRSEALNYLSELSDAGSESGIRMAALLPDHFLDQSSDVYCVEDLLKPDGDAFVELAYRSILGRPADPTGLEYWRIALRSGTGTKVEMLKHLLDSEEGKRLQPKVLGLNVNRPSDFPAGSIYYA